MTKKEKVPPLHPDRNLTWQPNLADHRRGKGRRLSKAALKQLEERTQALQEEIFSSQADGQPAEETDSTESNPPEETEKTS